LVEFPGCQNGLGGQPEWGERQNPFTPLLLATFQPTDCVEAVSASARKPRPKKLAPLRPFLFAEPGLGGPIAGIEADPEMPEDLKGQGIPYPINQEFIFPKSREQNPEFD